MEHITHIFGGGCGEHLLLPAFASAAVTMGAFTFRIRVWLARKFN